MLKSDKWIIENSLKGMVSPFESSQISKEGLLSFGVSSYGYDVRLANEFRVAKTQNMYYTPDQDHIRIATEILKSSGVHYVNNPTIDPKRFNEKTFYSIESTTQNNETFFVLPPTSFGLGRSVEHFNIPRNICVLCIGKSTYARCGLSVPITPLEPEWRGHITLEFANTTSFPMKIYVNEGVAQLLFLEGDECNMSYQDRKGKYQDQSGITLPR